MSNMHLFHIIHMMLFIGVPETQQLTLQQAKAVSDIATFFRTTHLTITENVAKKVPHIKTFSKNAQFIAVQSTTAIFQLVRSTLPHHASLIVAGYSQFNELYQISEESPGYNDIRSIRDRWKWAVVMEAEDSLTEPTFLIPFDAEVLFIEPSSEGYNIWEQYHIFQGKGKRYLMQSKIGTWSSQQQLILSKPQQFIPNIAPPSIYSRRDMSNSTFIIKTLKNNIFLRKRLPASYGKIVDLATECIDTFEMFFKYKQELVGVMADTSDIVGIDIVTFDSIPSQGNKVPIDIIGPLSKWKLLLYYQRLHEYPLESYAWAPFHHGVWLVMVAWMVAAALCLAFCRYYYFNIAGLAVKHRGFIRSFFSVFVAFTGQGNGDEIDKTASRIVDVSIWATVIYVTASYSALIFTFILIRHPYVPFENMQQFIDDGTYRYGGIAHSYQMNAHHYTTNDSAIFIAAQKFMDGNDLATIYPVEAIRRICNSSKYAFLSFENDIESEYSPCLIDRMKEPYYSTYLGIRTSDNFPYLKAFLKRLEMLRCTGIVARFLSEFQTKVDRGDTDDYIEVDLKLLKPLFSVLFVGLLLSFIIFIGEKAIRPKCDLSNSNRRGETIL